MSPIESLAQRLSERVKSGKVRVPPSPVVALRLMQLLGDEKSSLGLIKSTLEKDQALTAVVLRLANSARYRWAGREASSIQQAIVVLGRRALREISLAKELHERTVGNGPLVSLRRRAWREALAAAHVAATVAPFFGVVPDVAFVAGLLHDIGKVPVIGLFEELLAGVAAGDVPPDDVAWALVEHHHVVLGGQLAVTWGLPPELVASIARHHTDEAGAALDVIRLADEVVRLMDGSPALSAAELGAIASLSTEQCMAVAAALPMIPSTLDAFREPDESRPASVVDFELDVDEEGDDAGRRVTVIQLGLPTEVRVRSATETSLVVNAAFRMGQLVVVKTEDVEFHARVTGCGGSTSELKPWALSVDQLAGWRAFVDAGLEELYRLVS